ncbi:Crp/Fnr family transcriptional regulator [Granulicella sibirica]|uniref:Crp/Fnr family transcriptional regulator n=1 Tax=Granulicella sibirica TaxID=2479048 RepID=UPI001008792A|nr:Crp/Fnr family transcriptional regulator [Granulicella sibirica]
MAHLPFKNVLLSKFDAQLIERLELRPVDLPLNREIENPGSRIDNLFFLEEGMASMTTTFSDGGQVEVALAGAEAVLGASVLMGTKLSLNRVFMQVPGHGYSVRAAVAAVEFRRCEMFQDLTLRYLQAQFIQSAQTAGCNARHSLEQRLARWLLLCADRNGGRNLPFSHECIADMLGARRTSVTVAAGVFKAQGLIEYSRGSIHLLDIEGLEAQACECYSVVRNHLADFAEYDAGTGCSPLRPDPVLS